MRRLEVAQWALCNCARFSICAAIPAAHMTHIVTHIHGLQMYTRSLAHALSARHTQLMTAMHMCWTSAAHSPRCKSTEASRVAGCDASSPCILRLCSDSLKGCSVPAAVHRQHVAWILDGAESLVVLAAPGTTGPRRFRTCLPSAGQSRCPCCCGTSSSTLSRC